MFYSERFIITGGVNPPEEKGQLFKTELLKSR